MAAGFHSRRPIFLNAASRANRRTGGEPLAPAVRRIATPGRPVVFETDSVRGFRRFGSAATIGFSREYADEQESRPRKERKTDIPHCAFPLCALEK